MKETRKRALVAGMAGTFLMVVVGLGGAAGGTRAYAAIQVVGEQCSRKVANLERLYNACSERLDEAINEGLAKAGGGEGVDHGGDVPIPYSLTNQRVELADGEVYTLDGMVVFSGGRPYFEVDLSEHPWLANAKRRGSPLYPVTGSASSWKRYEGMRVRLQAMAKGEVTYPDSDCETFLPQYVITLVPVIDVDKK
jgi:hypothetical protein